MVICLERGADLHMAQLMPLPPMVSCFSKIQVGFTFLVPADLGSPGKGPLNGSVCVYVCCISIILLQLCSVGCQLTNKRIYYFLLCSSWYYCWAVSWAGYKWTGDASPEVHECWDGGRGGIMQGGFPDVVEDDSLDSPTGNVQAAAPHQS